MCTLTFIPNNKSNFIITSNRDEATIRKTIPPKVYVQEGVKLIFPKDELAGGTWIGVSSKKRLICLLNGGFTAHTRKTSYRMSRGNVVLDLLKSDDFLLNIEAYDLLDVEPFTIVVVDWREELKLYQMVWDGAKKYLSEMDSSLPHIWSASMLYTDAMKAMRKEWFMSFLSKNNLNPKSLLDFHKSAGTGDKNTDLQIDRGFLKTVSITQIYKRGDTLAVHYENLLNGNVDNINENFAD